jgi:hypothetical protein
LARDPEFPGSSAKPLRASSPPHTLRWLAAGLPRINPFSVKKTRAVQKIGKKRSSWGKNTDALCQWASGRFNCFLPSAK